MTLNRSNHPRLTAARCNPGDKVRLRNSIDSRIFVIGTAPDIGLPGYINLMWKDKVAMIVAGSTPLVMVEKALVLDTEEAA